jgi:hypothetical protein
MWPVAIFLMLVVGFYWAMFCVTIWLWLRAILNLCVGNFIRASLCFVAGTWMLLWWYDEPRGWDDFAPGTYVVIGLGVLATFARFWRRQQQAAQTVTPLEAAPATAAFVNININIEPGADPHLVKRALRLCADIDATQRLSGPTIIDQ